MVEDLVGDDEVVLALCSQRIEVSLEETHVALEALCSCVRIRRPDVRRGVFEPLDVESVCPASQEVMCKGQLQLAVAATEAEYADPVAGCGLLENGAAIEIRLGAGAEDLVDPGLYIASRPVAADLGKRVVGAGTFKVALLTGEPRCICTIVGAHELLTPTDACTVPPCRSMSCASSGFGRCAFRVMLLTIAAHSQAGPRRRWRCAVPGVSDDVSGVQCLKLRWGRFELSREGRAERRLGTIADEACDLLERHARLEQLPGSTQTHFFQVAGRRLTDGGRKLPVERALAHACSLSKVAHPNRLAEVFVDPAKRCLEAASRLCLGL